METRQARKQETIDRILGAATQVFAEIGFEGARVDVIAERAGVNKAMIYYHIGDKQALYTRILCDVFGDTAARMADNIHRADTPTDKIRAYIRSIGQTLEKHPQLPRVMMREMASGGSHLPDTVVKDLASIIAQIGRVIQEGHRQGAFNKVDPLMLHLMVMGGIGYYQTTGSVRSTYSVMSETAGIAGDETTLDDLLGKIENIVLNALSSR